MQQDLTIIIHRTFSDYHNSIIIWKNNIEVQSIIKHGMT